MTADLPDTLPETLHDRLDRLEVPAGDLGAARAGGTRLRRRRRAAAASLVGAAAAAVVVTSVTVGPFGTPDPREGRGIDTEPAGSSVAPLGRLDFSGGLRAYASPDGSEVHLGGRVFDGKDLAGLDTDAAATSRGIVAYDDGRPVLLDATGATRALEQAAEAGGAFTPAAKSDSDGSTVAYGAVLDGTPTVVVRDLASSTEVAIRAVDPATRIDALDRGVVALRDEAGTSLWDTSTGEVSQLAGPGTTVADLRGGVVLYDGPAPEGPAARDLTLVRGPIDAQLTFDGSHVLSWSGTLRSTDGGASIQLDRGPTAGGYAFWTFDTDGSVLVAVPDGQRASVYDCGLPSGTCETLAPVSVTSGDPMFIGNDM